MVQDLIAYYATHLKALLAGDRVDNHVAMNANEVLAVEDGVLVLAGRIDHLDGKVLVPIANDLAEGVFDGGVVRVDKVAVDVLHSQRALADGSAADNGHLTLFLLRSHVGGVESEVEGEVVLLERLKRGVLLGGGRGE